MSLIICMFLIYTLQHNHSDPTNPLPRTSKESPPLAPSGEDPTTCAMLASSGSLAPAASSFSSPLLLNVTGKPLNDPHHAPPVFRHALGTTGSQEGVEAQLGEGVDNLQTLRYPARVAGGPDASAGRTVTALLSSRVNKVLLRLGRPIRSLSHSLYHSLWVGANRAPAARGKGRGG
jgi:hypothetical protein